MKKSIVAASVASAALAAMPFFGAFADNITATDHLTVTVPGGCVVNNSRAASVNVDFGNMNPGTSKSVQNETAINITCNNGWSVTPSTTGLTGTGGTTITSEDNGKGSSFTLLIGTSSAEGINNGYSTAQIINGQRTISSTTASTSLSLTPTYNLTIGAQQEPATYTGDVVYTIATN